MSRSPRQILPMMCALALLAATYAPHGLAAPRPMQAMWVWGEADAGLVAWSDRRGIDTLLFEIPLSRADDASTHRTLRRAGRRGIDVWALSGHPDWAIDHGAAREWVRAVRGLRGLRGIVIDVEPYLLEQWDHDRAAVADDFLRMLRVVRRAARDLPVMVAVPFWFDHDEHRRRGGTLLDEVAARADALAVMAYRDRIEGSDGVAALARGEIDTGARLGKPVLIALQAAEDELDKLTFHEEGAAALERAVEQLVERFRTHPGFGGVALHHYRALRSLAP